MHVDIVAKHKHKQRPIKLEALYRDISTTSSTLYHHQFTNSRVHVFTFLSQRCSALLLHAISTNQPILIHTITINARKSEKRKTEFVLHFCPKCLCTVNLLCWSNKRRFCPLFECSKHVSKVCLDWSEMCGENGRVSFLIALHSFVVENRLCYHFIHSHWSAFRFSVVATWIWVWVRINFNRPKILMIALISLHGIIYFVCKCTVLAFAIITVTDCFVRWLFIGFVIAGGRGGGTAFCVFRWTKKSIVTLPA